MIEDVLKGNTDSILCLICGDSDIDPDDALFCAQKCDKAVVYKDETLDIVGCGTFRLWGEGKTKADLYIYVAPDVRRRGIGSELFASLMDVPERKGLEFVSTKIESDMPRSIDFFTKAGFEHWYTELILSYSGSKPSESKLNFISYTSEYFERYVDALRQSFYELRSSNDFKPYYCCEPNEAKWNELERNKDNVYLLLDGEKLIASVIVNKDVIEDVFVVPEYQGRGISKELLRFALNKAGEYDNVKLSAIKWNKRALNLYESIGFKTAKTITYMRLFLTK